jgi:precorrin-8X/cobalt-precorrin-8 methylmutase
MERALKENDTKLFIIGNAPTALSVLTDGINSGRVDPSLVIGVPVGFVGAAESKDELKASGAPCIITRGRKGGAPLLWQLVNAILLMMRSN